MDYLDLEEVLLIEDNLAVAHQIKHTLSGVCKVHIVSTIKDAVRAIANRNFHLLLVDITLPDGHGFSLISAHSHLPDYHPIPFVFLTCDTSLESQIAGFSLGAQDYITKPFNPHILKARVSNCLRRYRKNDEGELMIGNVMVSQHEFRAYRLDSAGKRLQLNLTSLEFRLLQTLVKNLGHAFSRENLIGQNWSDDTFVIDRVVDQHIFTLRKKLGMTALKIKTIYGFGYRMELEHSIQSDEWEQKNKPNLTFL